MNLSKHFTLEAITRSDTATRLGIDNSLPPEMVTYWTAGLVTLEAIEKAHGSDLILNSGYRCPELNRRIPGSSKTSAHTGMVKGFYSCAFDIECTDNADLFHTVKDMMQRKLIDVDQLIWEYGNDTAPAWVHVGFVYGKKMRNQLLRKRAGTKYEVWT